MDRINFKKAIFRGQENALTRASRGQAESIYRALLSFKDGATFGDLVSYVKRLKRFKLRAGVTHVACLKSHLRTFRRAKMLGVETRRPVSRR